MEPRKSLMGFSGDSHQKIFRWWWWVTGVLERGIKGSEERVREWGCVGEREIKMRGGCYRVIAGWGDKVCVVGKRGSGWVTWSCLKKICPLFFFWPGCYNIPMIFTILLNQLNLLLFDFSSISWKVSSSSLNSSNCCKTWYSSITSRFSSKLVSLLFTHMLYLLWMVEYRACQYHFLSMNFFTNNLALHMTILLHIPREKNSIPNIIFILGH